MLRAHLLGMRPGLRVRGVRFNGGTTANINCGAIHNAATKLWISFWFMLDNPFSSATATYMYLIGKRVDGTHHYYIRLNAANGTLHFFSIDGTTNFNVFSVQTSWIAKQWYHVIASMSSAEGVRLIVDKGTPVTDTDVAAIIDGGDFIIGGYRDPGIGASFEGVITDVVVGTDDLSEAEENNLYDGVTPGDEDNHWKLIRGAGLTAPDSAGNDDGTLGAACLWE